MRGKLTILILMFAILFGTVIMPTIAHAQAAAIGHESEIVEAHEHDASGAQDQQGSDTDKPCHAVAHHHCSAALKTDVTALASMPFLSQIRAIPLSSLKMTSLAQAPPTEPPAA
jgi:hypothetical protein